MKTPLLFAGILLLACAGQAGDGSGGDSGGQAGQSPDEGGIGGQAGASAGQSGDPGSAGERANQGGRESQGGNAGASSPAGGQGGDDTGGDGGMAAAGGHPAVEPPPGVHGCDGAAICDGFEDETTGQAPDRGWTTTADGNGAVVRVDTQHAYSGAKSVYAGNANGAPQTFIRPRNFNTWQPDALYGRMMMYFESHPVGGGGHFGLIQGEGRVSTDEGLGNRNALMRFGGTNNQYVGWANTYWGTGGNVDTADCMQAFPQLIETGKWICYEWMWNSATHEWAVWMDGAPNLFLTYKASDHKGIAVGGSVAEKKCWVVPKIQSLRLGWMQVHNPEGRLAMWMDDVAVSDKRIGCDPPSADTK